MTWLNWSLKLHSSLWTIPHLILTHNTQDFVQIMLISFVWLYIFKCDVYAQILADQTQKYFWVFYMFLKMILYFRDFSFCSKCIFVFFFKNWFRGLFARSLRLRASREMCLREISKVTFSYRKSHYCLTSISWLNLSREMFFRLKLEISKFHIKAIVTVLQLVCD